MKSTACLLISIVLLLVVPCPAMAGTGQPRLVRVGAFNYYPAIFKDGDGVVKGFYVDALAEIAQRENIRFEYIYGSWNEGIERLKNGDVDLLTSVAKTAERELYMDFTTTPLLTVWGELYVPLASELDGIRDIRGKKVAVMRGDFNAAHFSDLVKKFGISCTFVEMPGFDDVFKAVAAKEVDAGVVNSTFGVPKQKEYRLRSTGVVFNPFDIHFAVARDKNPEILALLDGYLETWRRQENSIYVSARQKWAHGTNEPVHAIPGWMIKAGFLLGGLVLAAGFFIFLLKRKVRKATVDIVERETRFRSYIDNAPDGVFITDMSGRYMEVNPAAARITGYSESELLQMRLGDILSPGSVDSALLSLDLLKQSGHCKADLEFRHKNGSNYWLTVDAVKLSDDRYLGFAKDITEKKWIEETQLFLARCGYRHPDDIFFESLARYLAEKLNMEYVCIDRLLGDGLVARTLAVYHDGEFEDNVEYALKDTPCGEVAGKRICCYQRDVRKLFPQDAALQDLRAESYVGTTLWGSDGNPIGLIAVIGRQPLLNQHLAESVMNLVSLRAAGELERLLAEQELKDKNSELERFTYTVSHDLKSPLITINTFAGMVLNDLKSGHHTNIQEDLGRISEAATRMGMLLDDLLQLSRIGRMMNEPTRVDMNSLVRETLEMLDGTIGQRQIEIVVQPGLPAIFGDRQRIGMVLQNLLENAVKYLGDRAAPRIEIGAYRNGHETVFSIADNGIGIDPRQNETIFGLFKKLDARSQGTGIGLALAKRIIDVHGGRIWVESEGPGKGSRFLFTVPEGRDTFTQAMVTDRDETLRDGDG